MKLITPMVGILAALVVACGGDDNGGNGEGGNGGGSAVVIAAADADRVARAALPTVAEMPGEGWLVVAEDDFGDDSSNGFAESVRGVPECETLDNLSSLGGFFGSDDGDDDTPIGRAQIEFEHQDADAFVPTAVEVEVEVQESAAGSRAQFTIVRELFESDETTNCLITVLNNQFAQSGPSGVSIEVKAGEKTVDAPQDGARMAFEIDMAVMGIEVDMAMQLFSWPYGNASVQAMFMGTRDTLTEDLIRSVLNTVDTKLQTAAE